MVTVPDADVMNTATFHKHLNKRHMPMGGMTSIYTHPHEEEKLGSNAVMRTYHTRVHETTNTNHNHK